MAKHAHAMAKQQEAIAIYARLMEEGKIRVTCIERALAGNMGVPGAVVREFCFLQLRFLC
jgi:hypothetical protein